MKYRLFKRKSFPVIIAFSILIVGCFVFRIFDSNGILAVVPNDNTTPDFEVVFGAFKISKCKHPANQKIDKNFIWIENPEVFNDKENACGPYYRDYFYVFEGDIVGFNAESNIENATIINPKLRIKSVKTIDKFNVYSYFIVAILALMYLLFVILKLLKHKR